MEVLIRVQEQQWCCDVVRKDEWGTVALQGFIFHRYLEPDSLVGEQSGGGNGTETVAANCGFETFGL